MAPTMRLLVSVASAAEASAALEGGADIIDAKDPLAGALGAVSADVLVEIHATVAGVRPLTAALGDAVDEAALESDARRVSAVGARLVKVGLDPRASAARVAGLVQAAVRGARAGAAAGAVARRTCGVAAVLYADAQAGANGAVGLAAEGFGFIEAAALAGARALLIDTADKTGPGLRRLLAPAALAAYVARAHGAGLLVAAAGKLTADDLPFVRDAGADIAGVRGAACLGGRGGRVSAGQVRRLRDVCSGILDRTPQR
jgi:uncharacterized protein (UPF0264 family)